MADTDGADRDTATDTGAAMLVTADVAAAMAGVSARTIRRWIQRGYLPATHSPDGYLVSPVDLATARAATGHGRGHGHSHGHRAAVTDADTATSAPTAVVSPSASAQLAAIRDEWLAPLVDRIAELERDRGRLEAERDAARAELAALKASTMPRTAPPGGLETTERRDTTTTAGGALGRLRRAWRAIRDR